MKFTQIVFCFFLFIYFFFFQKEKIQLYKFNINQSTAYLVEQGFHSTNFSLNTTGLHVMMNLFNSWKNWTSGSHWISVEVKRRNTFIMNNKKISFFFFRKIFPLLKFCLSFIMRNILLQKLELLFWHQPLFFRTVRFFIVWVFNKFIP